MKKLKTILLSGVLVFLVSSCSFLDATPENVVGEDDSHGTKTTIYADFLGLYSLVQDVMDDLIIVSELRGDLLAPTPQAPQELQDIHNLTASPETNSYVNPAKYYELVVNTNDFLRNVVQYNTDYPGVIPTGVYRSMVGGAICIRTWAYLTIGKLYGGAAYYDYSLKGEIDFKNVDYLNFDELVKQLIFFMNNGVDRINGFQTVFMDQMYNLSELEPRWRLMGIQPDVLITELFLWDKDYQAAAKRGINFLMGNGTYNYGNEYLLTSRSYGISNSQIISGAFYESKLGQLNDLYDFFYPTRDYYLTPTECLVDLFRYTPALKDKQQYPLTRMITYYNRLFYTADYTYLNSSTGDDVQMFVYKYVNSSESAIPIYRASDLHLMIAEALASSERFEAADSIINFGTSAMDMGSGSYPPPFNTPIWNSSKTPLLGGVRGNTTEPRLKSTDFLSDELKVLDGLTEDERAAHPLFGQWKDRKKYVLDSVIADEAARELGFEGKRWFTLLRMALNNDDPDILAVPVSKKYSEDDRPAMLHLLRQKEYWFFDDGIKNR